MRFFYLAIAETRRDIVEAIIQTIAEWNNSRVKGRVKVGVLVRYTKWRSRECIPCRTATEHNIPVIIDNGAFTFLTSTCLETRLDPFSLARWRMDYAVWLSSNTELYDYAVLPDIPVHGRRFLDEKNRLERIKLSARNQELFLRVYGGILPLSKLVPVIQGYTIGEYSYSFKLLSKSGVLKGTAYEDGDYKGILGVGSVCVRKWNSKRRTAKMTGGKVAGSLNEWLPVFLSKCCREVRGFHFFGLHSNAVRAYGRHPRFYSSDSGAHGYSYKYKWRSRLGCKAPNTPECASRAVEAQLERTLGPFLVEQEHVSALRGNPYKPIEV